MEFVGYGVWVAAMRTFHSQQQQPGTASERNAVLPSEVVAQAPFGPGSALSERLYGPASGMFQGPTLETQAGGWSSRG